MDLHPQGQWVVEMRMIWSKCGNPRFSRIRNELIGEKVGVAPIEVKTRKIKPNGLGSSRAG